MAREGGLTIVFPQHERFMIGRAHDNAIIRTCHALARRGNRVHLLMGKTSPDPSEIVRYYGLEPHENLHLVQLPILRPTRGKCGVSWHGVFHHFCVRAIRSLARREQANLIYIREMKLARYLLKRRKTISLPLVYEIHSLRSFTKKGDDGTESFVFQNSDGLITTTRVLKNLIEKVFRGISGIDWNPLAADIPEERTLFAPPGPGEPWRLCYIGQLHEDQGVDILVRALGLLPENVHADIIGGADAGIDRLRKVAESARVQDRLVFHGFVPPGEVSKRASGAHVFILPCLPSERKSAIAHLKVYEYLALGRPVIASDLPSSREEVEDGKTGYLIEPNSESALANAVERLTSNPEKTAVMAEKASRAARGFTFDARADRLTRYFRTVLDNPRKS
jgi:glycosyltransferase involved in cell wall biosynthesis